MKPLEEQGYIIPAFNIDATDYIACANQLAKSLLAQNPSARICLLTNVDYVDNDNLYAYVHVVELLDKQNGWANDCLIFKHTPFRETIKLEADMLVADSIDHWWDIFRKKDVVLSIGCRDWKNQPSTSRYYRKTFDENNLPDVYNAITYWRLSTTAQDFFTLVRAIFFNWDKFKTLIKYAEEIPSTDLVYAIAAKIVGVENVTVPGSPTIVHMKKHHAGTKTENWTSELVWEFDPLRIQTVAQHGVFHYNIKDWIHNDI